MLAWVSQIFTLIVASIPLSIQPMLVSSRKYYGFLSIKNKKLTFHELLLNLEFS